ncbi:MAG TPA: APC family permease [Vicinamibacterales bacterium]|nr:APC family permease [Vicinamibacterales bacterium]
MKKVTGLITSLTLWDVVAMNIVAIVGLRWISRSARIGAPATTLWILACVLFFVPLAAALAELSSRHPQQGGIYAWARRAFGPLHGFICGWCMWVNNLFYFPSLLLFGAANALIPFGADHLADNRFYSVTFVLGFMWATTFLNILGFSAGKWLQHLGSIATWIPAALLIGSGAIAFATLGSATSFAPSELVPRENFWDSMSFWSSLCFAFSGFEIASMVGQEVYNPRKTIPRSIVLSGIAITIIYILGSASILVAVPASEMAERSGIADAVEIVTGRLGLAGMGGFIGVLLFVGSLGGVSSWIAGAARVPFAAGVDSAMPAAFARLHPKYRTPHVALVVQGIATSVLFLASVFISVGGGETTIQEAYDIMVNLTILVYFLPYLYLFAAFLRLRTMDAAMPVDENTVRIPGGPFGAWLVAGCGMAATLIAMGLLFIPPTGTENVLNYEVNLIGQAALLVGIGMFFYWSAARGRRSQESDSSSPPLVKNTPS